jgi:hypothetical protein
MVIARYGFNVMLNSNKFFSYPPDNPYFCGKAERVYRTQLKADRTPFCSNKKALVSQGFFVGKTDLGNL